MGLSIKEKKLIGVIGTILVAAIGGSVWALTISKDTGSREQDTTSEEEKLDDSIEDKTNLTSNKDEESNDSKDTDDSSPQINTAPRTNTSTGSSASPSRNAEQSTGAHTHTTPPKEHATPSQPVAVCDEGMKAGYTGTKASQITQENLRYSREMDAIDSEIARRNLHFSGIAQEMRDNARASYEANLASIEAEYQLNLRLINC